MKQALFYEKLNGDVQCNLCPRNCKISQNNRGICDVRENKNGELFSLVYGKIASMNVDPIEKKPLFHFAPGTDCLSIATVGCNLKCSFCQNWEISHPKEIVGKELSPEEIIEFNNKYNSPGIAYTYTEPTVFYEYALDIMKLAKKQGLYNIWVSNGFTNIEPIKKIAKYLDAINVDMKGDIEFYQKLCGIPNEDPIRQALKEYKKQNVWIEITNLIIPGYNDKSEQIENLVKWIKENLSVNTPIHFSRFYPQYQLTNVKPTPVETLEKAVEIAKKHLNYVYLGNVPGNKHENTYCPKCNSLVIERFGLKIKKFSLKCNKCGEHVIIKGKEHIPKNLPNQ
jgi:pyruvate formate lyase activating enzyme